MKTKTIFHGTAVTALSVLLIACGGSSSSDSDPVLLGAAITEGQTDSAANTNFVAITDSELGDLANVPDTKTASLQVLDDFTFDTSRSTTVSMSIPEARNVDAEATFCTDYSAKNDGTYDIDYNSCVLSAPLLGGVLNEELNLVNQHASVIGVVWFQDPAIQPVYQEYHFD